MMTVKRRATLKPYRAKCYRFIAPIEVFIATGTASPPPHEPSLDSSGGNCRDSAERALCSPTGVYLDSAAATSAASDSSRIGGPAFGSRPVGPWLLWVAAYDGSFRVRLDIQPI